MAADAPADDAASGDAASGDASEDAHPDPAPDAGLGLPYAIRLGAPQALSQACGVAADDEGNVYVVGQTDGPLWGNPPLGRRDLFLARVRASGALEWVRQVGDQGTGLGIFTGGCAVAVGAEGEAYVAGTANGTGLFQGQTLPGVYTGFAARFDKQGAQRWLRLIGEAPGPTEAMAVDVHAGAVNVLAWTEASLDGYASRGQGDPVLVRLDAGTGALVKTLRFGSSAEDVPMGLVRDVSGLWVGFRRFAARFTQPLGHELVHLGAEDAVVDRLVADAQDGFGVIDYSATPAGKVVLLGVAADDSSQTYALREQHRDGSLGPLMPGDRAGIMQVRALSCGRDGCAVAGQVLQESTTGGDSAVIGFVHIFTPQLEAGPRATIVGKAGSSFTSVAALAPAPGGHWYAAGWSGATVWEHPPIGSTDGLAFRLSPRAEVAAKP